MQMALYATLVIAAAIAGGFCYRQVSSLVRPEPVTKTEMRYIACIERGNDPQSCAIEQVMLRGLTCKS